MQTQVKPNVSWCRHGMRDCPVEQCSLRNPRHTVLYSSVLKKPIPTTPATPMAKLHQFGEHEKFFREAYNFQHASVTPTHPIVNDPAVSLLSSTSGAGMKVGTGSVNPVDGNGIVQAADQVAVFRVWLDGQMDAQKAKIKAMSEQFSIPVPNLDSNAFDSPPLPLMTPSVRNAVATTTDEIIMPQENIKDYVFEERKVPGAPPAPRMLSALPVLGSCRSEAQGSLGTARAIASGPLSARAPLSLRSSPLGQGPNPGTRTVVVSDHSPQVMSTAPKKDDLAYKTTPCKHYTLNGGWCPWGDECGFIHDPELGWFPPSERTSGRSTPSSTLGGNKYSLPEKTAIDAVSDPRCSVSSKSAHCWGYIQGICPHSDMCRYLHPVDIVPYIKYTPCLTWPRCGYPAQDCPLKHIQVDKLTSTRQTQPPSTLGMTTIDPRARSVTAPLAETYSDAPLAPQRQSQPPFMAPSMFNQVGGFVIPHDEAYASAKLHHRPTAPSADMFTPAPVRPLVRLRRPSEDMSQGQVTKMQHELGMSAYQGRTRSASIAVQRLGSHFSGPVLQTQAKMLVRGHGRGKSLNL